MTVLIILLLVAGLVAFAAKIYNTLRERSEKVKRANSDMSGEMRKRATLVNQLVDVCKGYGEHEKLTHITVAGLASSTAESASMAHSANTVIDRVTTIAANFPALKANGTYEKLMQQVEAIEAELQGKREIYNRAVEIYNTYRASFPVLFVAEPLGFPEAKYFRTDETGLEESIVFRTDDGAMLRDTMRRLGESAGRGGKALAQQAGQQIERLKEARVSPANDAPVSHQEIVAGEQVDGAR